VIRSLQLCDVASLQSCSLQFCFRLVFPLRDWEFYKAGSAISFNLNLPWCCDLHWVSVVSNLEWIGDSGFNEGRWRRRQFLLRALRLCSPLPPCIYMSQLCFVFSTSAFALQLIFACAHLCDLVLCSYLWSSLVLILMLFSSLTLFCCIPIPSGVFCMSIPLGFFCISTAYGAFCVWILLWWPDR
jgi:hypothetical protein